MFPSPATRQGLQSCPAASGAEPVRLPVPRGTGSAEAPTGAAAHRALPREAGAHGEAAHTPRFAGEISVSPDSGSHIFGNRSFV